MSNAGRFSTARMVVDYTDKLYMPLSNLTQEKYSDVSNVEEFISWKDNMTKKWNKIKLEQLDNLEHTITSVGNEITVQCKVELDGISVDDIEVQLYYGKILSTGVIEEKEILKMDCISIEKFEGTEKSVYEFEATIELNISGNYGYTFRVVPRTDMVLRQENLNLVKCLEK